MPIPVGAYLRPSIRGYQMSFSKTKIDDAPRRLGCGIPHEANFAAMGKSEFRFEVAPFWEADRG